MECVRAQVAEAYSAEDSKRAALRTKRWRARTDRGRFTPNPTPRTPSRSRLRTAEDREHDRLRQARHRELKLLRPREPVTDGIDPAALAAEGLHHLHQLRHLATNKYQHEHLEVVAEVIRRLAWGPDDSA